MKTMRNILKILVFSGLLFLQVTCGGSSGTPSSPPISLPSPVSHATISSPDASGSVRVTGEAGFADGGTAITVTNLSVASGDSALKNFLLSRAYAATSASIVAESDGSFQTTIEASAGNSINLAYTLGGTEKSSTSSVPNFQTPLPTDITFSDMAYDSANNKAYAVGNDGIDGFVYPVNLSTKTLGTAITLSGGSSAEFIAIDNTDGTAIVIDSENNLAFIFDLATATVTSASILSSSDVATFPGFGGLAIIAHTNSSSVSASLFDLEDLIAISISSAMTDDGDLHDDALLIATDTNSVGEKVFAHISLMEDGNIHLLAFHIDPDTLLISQTSATELDTSNPGGLALFSNGTKALVTDRDNDRVLLVDIVTEGITNIAVGDDPRGVAVGPDESEAFVVNSGGRTVSTINLSDNSVATSNIFLGLSPTEILLDPTDTNDVFGVLNTTDNSVSIFEEAHLTADVETSDDEE